MSGIVSKKKYILLSISISLLFSLILTEIEGPKQKASSPNDTPPLNLRQTSSIPQSLSPTPRPSISVVKPTSRLAPAYQKIRRELSRFHHPDTKILIEKRKILSPRRHKVRIIYILPTGRHTSFKAILDLKENTLSRRWGRTIHENIGPTRIKIFPDGKI